MDRRLSLRFTAFSLAVALLVADAKADVPASVSVALPGCPAAVDDSALVRLLRIELGTDGVRDVVTSGTAGVLARIRVEATCTADPSEVDAIIEDIATRKTVRRSFSVAGIPHDARPRALAIAVAELLRASWVELAIADAPPSKAVPSEVAIEMVERVQLRQGAPLLRSRPGTMLSFAFDSQLFASYGSVVVGPSLGISVPMGSVPVRVRAEVLADFGRAEDELGTIRLSLFGGGVGVMLAGGNREVHAELGPMLAVGHGDVTGEPKAGATGSSGGGVVVTTAVGARFGVRVGRGWWTMIGLDGGVVLVPLEVTAAERTAAGFGGPLLGAKLGVAYAF